MKKDKISKKIVKLVSEILNIKNLSYDASQQNTKEWDSLAYLSIVDKLEKQFGVKINSKNINNFSSIEKIVKEIKSKSN